MCRAPSGRYGRQSQQSAGERRSGACFGRCVRSTAANSRHIEAEVGLESRGTLQVACRLYVEVN